jgi:signal transduction histidine kinase/CheY-like chemotaxis protein
MSPIRLGTSLGAPLATLVLTVSPFADAVPEALRGAGLDPCVCTRVDEFIGRLDPSAGVAVICADGLDDAAFERVASWARDQPAWSDLPFVLLSDRPPPPCLDPAGANVLLLPRSVGAPALASAALTALRARRRQFDARGALGEQALRAQNAALAEHVAARRDELAEANRRLAAEAAERERAEHRLQQSQKMEAVGRLTGGIAHDFNNLLSAIMGNIELLRPALTDARAGRLADNAMLAAERGAKLTGQLLAFSRMQRLDLIPVDLAALLETMRGPLERVLGPNISLALEVAPTAGAAMADVHQIKLALLNLASNARDAMPAGGRLTISAELDDGSLPASGRPGQYVVLTIADTGIGMPPEVRERAFEPFYTTKSVGAGSGLGLSQVYGIAKQSGGLALIESAPGAGAKVRIMLPCAPFPPTERRPAEAEGLSLGDGRSQAQRRENVLVVDDDPDVRRFMVESLDALGYGVTEAESGQAGLDQLDRAAPDIMILDFAMPDMNGAVVANEALRRRPGLPILFATGFADSDALGGPLLSLPLLRKPFRIADLAAAVAAALAGGRAGTPAI